MKALCQERAGFGLRNQKRTRFEAEEAGARSGRTYCAMKKDFGLFQTSKEKLVKNFKKGEGEVNNTIRFAVFFNYCGCSVEARISRRTRKSARRPFRRLLHNDLDRVSPPKIRPIIVIINTYKPELCTLTLALCIKSRHFCICFKLSTNYLQPSFHSSQIILFNNLTSHCSVSDILLHHNNLTIP